MLTPRSQKFFRYEYLLEIEAVYENTLTCQSGAQMVSLAKK